MIMDAQDIIELIEYFRNLQDNEMKFEIEELRGYIDIRFEELYDKLTEYIDFNHSMLITKLIVNTVSKLNCTHN